MSKGASTGPWKSTPNERRHRKNQQFTLSEGERATLESLREMTGAPMSRVVAAALLDFAKKPRLEILEAVAQASRREKGVRKGSKK